MLINTVRNHVFERNSSRIQLIYQNSENEFDAFASMDVKVFLRSSRNCICQLQIEKFVGHLSKSSFIKKTEYETHGRD